MDPESYQKISEIVSVTGTVLKRSSKLLVKSGDGRKMEGTAKFEVTRIAESEVTEADLEVPAACRDSVRGRKL